MIKRPPITHKFTRDGSSTLFRLDLDEPYHSFHGALQESLHVFINMGLKEVKGLNELNLFEVGFGTGLNAWLTFFEKASTQKINYHSCETIPLGPEEWNLVNYCRETQYPNGEAVFHQLHQAQWEKYEEIQSDFSLKKEEKPMQELKLKENHYHLVYFDAFAPNKQEELWELPVFEQLHSAIAKGGILVTYCAKGQVRRDLQNCGFLVERLPGPPGKREMLRAQKPL